MCTFPQYINGRLMLAIIAVALSASFYYEPSFPRSILDNDEAIQKLEKVIKKEVEVNEKEMIDTYLGLFVKNKLQDTTYWGSQIMGATLGWRAAQVHELRSVLIQANTLRFLGLILHFGELAFWLHYPLSAEPPSQPATVAVEEVSFDCGCGHLEREHFEELEISKETENDTITTTTTTAATATITPLPLSSDQVEKPKEHTDVPACPPLEEVTQFYISFWNRCFNGAFFGMSDFLGILYLYELAPKGSRIYSVSCLAFYFMLKATLKYYTEMVIAPNVTYTSEKDISTWLASGILTLAAMVFQIIILRTFCLDSPSYLIHQKKRPADAKKALMELRQTEEVDKELELLEKKKSHRDPLVRTTLLLSMYMIYLVYNYTYIFLGMVNAVALGVPKYISVNIYYVLNIFAFYLPLRCHKSLHLITIRNVLLYYFVFLGTTYFMSATLIPTNMEYGTDLLKNRQAGYVFVVVLAVFMHVISTSGLTLFTIVLVNEYNSQTHRVWNITVAGILGMFVSFFGLYIYLKGILIFYHFQPMPWVFLALLTWFVGKYDMVRFGLAPSKPDSLDVVDACFRVQDEDTPKIEKNSMYEINLVNEMKRMEENMSKKEKEAMNENKLMNEGKPMEEKKPELKE